MQILRRTGHLLGHHHQLAPVQQGAEDVPHGDVEYQRMPLRPHGSRPHQSGVDGAEELRHILVSDRHALRNAGGSRGVDQVGEVIGGRSSQRGAGL